MAKKKNEDPIKPQPAANAGDTVASGLFGGAAFRPIGETLPNLGRSIISGQSPTMMAGSAGANPLVASGVPDFPSGLSLGPLVNTSRFSGPPSERPDWRDPAQQWDTMRPTTPTGPSTVGSGRTISQADAIAQNNANMTENQRRGYGLLSLSPSSADVAMAVYRGAPSGIAGGAAPTTLSPSFDQGIASSRYNLAQSLNQTPMAPVSTNIAGATERKGIQTAYGMIYPAAGQEAGAERSAALGPMGARYSNVRQESNQADKIAQMRERGAAIGTRLAGEEDNRQKGLQRDYYSFRQGLEQDRFQSAMSQAEKSLARGESGRDAMRMAEQARYGGEIMRQAGANVGTKNRTPFFSWERASMPSGEKFYRGDMGEYSRVVRDLAAAPQFGRANTTQRSWDNYVGPNPIKSFRYSGGA